MKFHPFPYIDDNKSIPLDGAVLMTPEYCYTADRETCKEHYDSIESEDGFHTCPYGFSTYVESTKGLIYTGLRIRGEYDREKLKNRVDDEAYLPTIPKRVIERAADNSSLLENEFDRVYEQLQKIRKESEEIEDFVDSILHEIRNFNRDIKFYAEETDRVYEGSGKVSENIKRVNALAHLISIRLNSYDVEKNPEVITNSSRYPKVIHKKFYKAKKVLERKEELEDVRIKLIGDSSFEWQMYDIFDIVPFLLLDNAIKYSPPKQDIEVVFDSITNRCVKVSVKSLGPKLKEGEVKRIMKRRERGEFAGSVDESGGGYGLYLANMICKIHDVPLVVRSGDRRTTIDAVPYSEFCVELTFDKSNI